MLDAAFWLGLNLCPSVVESAQPSDTSQVSIIGRLGTLYKLAHNYEKASRPACDWQMVAQPTLLCRST